MKVQLAVEVFKRVFVCTTSIVMQKAEEPEFELVEHEEPTDLTSIPLGFTSND